MKHFMKYLLVGLTMFIFACSDPCEGINCENGGVCDDGTCLCETGYSGANCEVENRTAFLGEWSGTVSCTGEEEDTTSFVATTSEEGNDKLLLTFDDGTSTLACATSPTTLVIQEFTVVDPFFGLMITTSGTGNLADATLSLDLDIQVEGFGTTQCTYVCTQ